ncbi:MAG: hypothetical protein Q9162_006362 [Coniocarpon cinnabarinum]
MSDNLLLDLDDGLVIRRMQSSDAHSMSFHANDADIARQMRDRFPSPYTLESAHEWINLWKDETQWQRSCEVITDPRDPTHTDSNNKPVPTAYVIAHRGQAIGGIGVMFRNDVERRNAEIGYWCQSGHVSMVISNLLINVFLSMSWPIWPYVVRGTSERTVLIKSHHRIGREFWNRGITTRAVRAFVKWVLDTWAYLVRLEANAYSTNPASGHVLRKAGFKLESTRRAAIFKCGQIIDVDVYVRLRLDRDLPGPQNQTKPGLEEIK